MELDVPRNKNFSPVIDLFVWDITKLKSDNLRPLLGYGVVNLKDELKIYKEPPKQGEEPQEDFDSDDQDD